MGESVLTVNNLVTSYKNFGVKNINFQLHSGDIMGLVGRSGSGKSTLINTLLGLKKEDSGNIFFSENNVQMDLKNSIGYSAQANSLFEFLTVEENIYTFGELNGLSRKEIEVKIDGILKKFDLEKARHKRIVNLSGGMKKRTDLAVTLVHDPKLIILDEPFTGLDVSMNAFIWQLIKTMAAEGKIFLITSHLLHDLQKNCNKFGLIHEGEFHNNAELVNALQQTHLNFEDFLERLFRR